VKQVLAITALLVLGLTVVAPSQAASYVYQANLYGDQVVPAVNTEAWGFVRFFFNDDFTEADVTVDVKGLSANLITGADIHAGKTGQNGGVVIHLSDGGFLTASTHVKLSAADLQNLVQGNWYAVVKTASNPQGEIRGQILLPAGVLPGQAPTQPPAPTSTVPPTVTPCAADCGVLEPIQTATRTPTPATTPAASSGTISPPNTGGAGLKK
jgi:hypothetical protein